jgi:predicted site-specific integrase-resolvase
VSRSREEWVAEEKGVHSNHSTSREFALLLGIDESTFKRWVKAGKVPAEDAVTPSGWRLWSPQQVQAAIRKRAGQ